MTVLFIITELIGFYNPPCPLEQAPVADLLLDKSPKSTAFPVAAIVITSMSVFGPG